MSDESPRTDPNPGLLRGEAQEPAQHSSVRPAGSEAAGARRDSLAPARSDTLLSAPAQATREDLALEQRLSECERQVSELDARLEALERRPVELQPSATGFRWFWLVFLAAVALAWQIVSHFR